MKCLVLGGRGFLGSHLCEALLAEGHTVRIFDRPKLNETRLGEWGKEVEWVEGDFLNRADVTEAVQGCEVVFHLISTTLPRSSNENPAYDLEGNVVTTLHLLETASRLGVKKLIFVSSGGTVYGIPREIPIRESHPTDPICSYGIAKLTIEKYLQLFRTLHGLDYCILRLANPFGPRQRIATAQGAVTVFLDKALRGETIEIWGEGSITRDYFYVSDAVAALVKAIGYKGEARIFNIGSGAGKSLNEILDTLDHLMGMRVNRRYLPGRKFDVPANVLDNALALEHLGWKPEVPFSEGLSKTLEWLKTRSDSS
jgi:UDP-glucose 4-epimerase